MGADLICYILKGPRVLELSPEQRAQLEIHGVQIIEFLDQHRPAWLDGGDHEGFPDIPSNLYNDYLADAFEDDEYLWNTLVIQSSARILDELIGLWNGDYCRDLAIRVDPDDSTQQIAVAGELSWGDEPDGLAFQTFKSSGILGYLDALGIR